MSALFCVLFEKEVSIKELDLKKKENENYYQYIWRVDSYIQAGKCKSWSLVTPEVNKQLFEDNIDLYRDESAYRKPCSYVRNFIESKVIGPDSDEYLKTLEEKCREFERERVKLRDERTSWNQQNRLDARFEQKLDYLCEQLIKIGKCEFPETKSIHISSDEDMIICLSDLHLGQCFSSPFGEYNSDIAKERLTTLLNRVKTLQNLHKTKRCYVANLGDSISGSIHKELAVTNRENVIDQIKIVSEILASFCYELTTIFDGVFFINVAGNHSRIERKEDSHHLERLDDLISFILEKTLCTCDSFHVLNQKLDIGIAQFNVRGKTYVAVHGDFDSFSKQGIANLSMMLGFLPDVVLMGHNHFPAFADIQGVKVVQTGTLAGSGDNYTIEKRLFGKPSQTILICNSVGIETYYPVEL